MLPFNLEEISINKLVPKLTDGLLLAKVLSKSIQILRLIHLLNQFGEHNNEMPEVPG